MSFSVMAGRVPAIHVVRHARGRGAQPTGRRQYRRLRRHWTTWMAGTSPAMTVGAADVTRFIQGDRPEAGAELAMTVEELWKRKLIIKTQRSSVRIGRGPIFTRG